MKLQRTHNCGELRPEHVGEEVILNGWVMSCRNHGGLLFVDMRDRYGITQVRLDPEKTIGAEEFKSETVIAVKGKVSGRPDANINKKRATGAVEVLATECELLGPCKTPPFEVVEEIETREELRLEYRYLDMRRETLTKAIVFRSNLAQKIREVFHSE
jgi:aspartyl-tRNA synthetase